MTNVKTTPAHFPLKAVESQIVFAELQHNYRLNRQKLVGSLCATVIWIQTNPVKMNAKVKWRFEPI